jgi:hypothetical protein
MGNQAGKTVVEKATNDLKCREEIKKFVNSHFNQIKI